MGRTTDKHFSRGYQEAIHDIASAGIRRADDPVAGMLAWMKDNAMDPNDREYVTRLQTWLDASEAFRDRATDPRIGDRTSCKHCEHDIEFVGGFASRWHDRGGNSMCPSGDAFQARLHEPMSDA